MKLKFNPNLEYQADAVSAVVDLFLGQSPKQCNFTVSNSYGQTGMAYTEHGIGNLLELDEEELLTNLQAVQLRNGIAQTKHLKKNDLNFDIEMETGTGKTYVYLRTAFELNKNYGFTKFIIVVPSIAIKEGVHKSLEMTNEHFKGLYDNTIAESFIYDSSKLEQVRNFAVSDNIQIMIINIDAFRKSFTDPDKETKANIIHRSNDKLNGMKPIELISETNPFVIIDEPQSVDNTPKSKEAIRSLSPVCTLRYSATHREKHNLVYKLDAVDAYELGLVKQIEVASVQSIDYNNHAYLKLISVDNKKSPITAKIEVDVHHNKKVTRKVVTVKQGDDLSDKRLTNREIYEGFIINDIYCEPGNEYVDFTSRDEILRLGIAVGDIDDLQIKRMQIKKTIQEHLDKELRLNKRGIKVLSLFFVDRVSNYRYYDNEGNPQKGIYAEIFEEEYTKEIQKPKYNTLFKDIDVTVAAQEVHNGYFAQDKKGVLKDTKGNTADDEDAYSLIMKDKERLLSFDTKLRFIFSHSALREGWDNPNVFQICTLNETNSNIKKRQEIGRGMRLCVNQDGERLGGFEVNTLTVMANESYEEFAATLQKEIADEENIKFGILETHSFANVLVKHEDGSSEYLGQEMSEKLYKHFESKGYIDASGKVQNALKTALKNNSLDLPPEAEPNRSGIVTLAKKVCSNLNIKNADDKHTVHINKQIYLGDDFKELWDKIKYKTTYSVQFDTEKLISECVKEIQLGLNVKASSMLYTKGQLNLQASGIETKETKHITEQSGNMKEVLPDIISFLQNETNLTRRTIVRILTESKTLHLFKKNPQTYMDEVAKIIVRKMRLLLVDGIKYTKIGDGEFYAQELFESEELSGYLSKNMVNSTKSPFEYVVYDSGKELEFAKKFEDNEDIKVYAKLPDWFIINTPLGGYNPDWAVLVNVDGEQKLYFVVETKGNTNYDALRPTEFDKIECGRKHFEALGNTITFKEADDFDKFIENVRA